MFGFRLSKERLFCKGLRLPIAWAYSSLVSFLTSLTNRALPLMLSIKTMMPNLRPKYVVSMITLALVGVENWDWGMAFFRWRRMVCRLHPCCSASCAAVCFPDV